MRVLLFFLCILSVYSTCFEERDIALSNNRIGVYIPQCHENNTWMNPQCHGSTGFCWCVNVYGEKLSGEKYAWNLEC